MYQTGTRCILHLIQTKLVDVTSYLQCLCVPDLHGLIKGTGDKHACVIRIPLNRLYTEFVDIPARPKNGKKKKRK